LKFSAIEIYNESVRDLLSPDCTPLRLLDDPEVNIFISYRTSISAFYSQFCNLTERDSCWETDRGNYKRLGTFYRTYFFQWR